MTFDDLCKDIKCTQEEREVLAERLAALRYKNTLGLAAERELNDIYETQAIEAAMLLMSRLNIGQVQRIREANPNLADFFVAALCR